MSYTVKNYSYTVSKKEFISANMEDFYNSLSGLKFKSNSKEISKIFKPDIMGFDINQGTDYLEIRFKKVITEGHIVGFCGYYLDLESGYMLLGKIKDNEYFPFFSLYKFLEMLGVSIIPEYITTLVERFKIGHISIDDFLSGVNNSNRYQSNQIKSVIYNFLNNQIDKEGDLSFNKFKNIIMSFSKMFDSELKDSWNPISGSFLKKISNYSYLTDFLFALISTYDISYKVYRYIEGGESFSHSYSDKFRDLSSMYHSSIDNDLSDLGDENILLNIFDIAEQQDIDVALDFVLDLTSLDIKYGVIQKIGIEEYMRSGNALSKIKASLSSSNSKRILKKFKDNTVKLNDIGKGSHSYPTYSNYIRDDFDSNIKDISKVLDKLDKLLA